MNYTNIEFDHPDRIKTVLTAILNQVNWNSLVVIIAATSIIPRKSKVGVCQITRPEQAFVLRGVCLNSSVDIYYVMRY